MWIFTIIVFVKSDLLFASYFKIEQKQLGTYFQSSQIDRNRKLIKWVSFVNIWLYVEQKHRVQAREGRLFSYSLLFIKNSQLWKENQINKLWSVQWVRESNGCSWLLSSVKSLRHKKGRFETIYLFKLMKKIHDL